MKSASSIQGGWLQTAALPLKVVGVLGSLILALNFCLEILALLSVQRAHQSLLLVLLVCLAVWALLEIVVLRLRGTRLPLTPLLVLLVVQLAVEVARMGLLHWGPPIGIDRSYGIGVRSLDPLLAILPIYVLVFLAIGRALIANHTAEIEAAYAAVQESSVALERLATTDPLTGVFNRRHFEEVATTEIARARRYGVPLSLVIFDIDHFKSVNDRFGHQAGDRVLTRVTHLVREHLRVNDTLARWGGEEFVVLLPHRDAGEATRVAEKLRTLIGSTEFDAVGHLTCSFGVARLGSGDSVDSLIHRADQALYEAKGSGRDTVRTASPAPPGP